MLRLSKLLEAGVVLPDLEGRTTDEVIGEMLDALIASGIHDSERREDTLVALLKRESTSTTGLGSGIALPHAKLPYLSDFVCALGVSRKGVDFRSSDQLPVRLVFLLLSPIDDPYGHLSLMGVIAGLVRTEGFVDELSWCRSAQSALDHIGDAERQLHPDD